MGYFKRITYAFLIAFILGFVSNLVFIKANGGLFNQLLGATTQKSDITLDNLHKLPKGKCPVAPTIESISKTSTTYYTDRVKVSINVETLSNNDLKNIYVLTKQYNSSRTLEYKINGGKKKELIGNFNDAIIKKLTTNYKANGTYYTNTIMFDKYMYIAIFSGSNKCYYRYVVKNNETLTNYTRTYKFSNYNILTPKGSIKGLNDKVSITSSNKNVLKINKERTAFSYKATGQDAEVGNNRSKSTTKITFKMSNNIGSFNLTLPQRYYSTGYLLNPVTNTNARLNSKDGLSKAKYTKNSDGKSVYGVEIPVSKKVNAHAMDSGTVIKVRNSEGKKDTYGKIVQIKSIIGDNSYIHTYANLGSITVKENDRVHKGQVIGKTKQDYLFVSFTQHDDTINKNKTYNSIPINNLIGKKVYYPNINNKTYKGYRTYIKNNKECEFYHSASLCDNSILSNTVYNAPVKSSIGSVNKYLRFFSSTSKPKRYQLRQNGIVRSGNWKVEDSTNNVTVSNTGQLLIKANTPNITVKVTYNNNYVYSVDIVPTASVVFVGNSLTWNVLTNKNSPNEIRANSSLYILNKYYEREGLNINNNIGNYNKGSKSTVQGGRSLEQAFKGKNHKNGKETLNAVFNKNPDYIVLQEQTTKLFYNYLIDNGGNTTKSKNRIAAAKKQLKTLTKDDEKDYKYETNGEPDKWTALYSYKKWLNYIYDKDNSVITIIYIPPTLEAEELNSILNLDSTSKFTNDEVKFIMRKAYAKFEKDLKEYINTKSAMKDKIIFAPVVTSWYDLYKTPLQVRQLHAQDNRHPAPYGQYIIATSLYYSITRSTSVSLAQTNETYSFFKTNANDNVSFTYNKDLINKIRNVVYKNYNIDNK